MDVGSKLGHYEITGRLGAGGMGQVYRARDSRLDRDVAIKVVPAALATDATLLARFEREAKLLAAVVHPNIATVHGVEAAGERPYLVMELVHGTTLADRLREGPLPLDEAKEIISQIAHGLEAAHKQEIVHRDLKPANVVITPDGLVKILDFGIAKALTPDTGAGTDAGGPSPEEPTAALELTEVGAPIGTAPYMSPEQMRGKAVDARSDIWAFGCVAYETLAGRRAFDRQTAADTLSAILNEEPDWELLPPETPVNVRSVLARCLEKDARRRLHSIADARIEIEDSVTDPGVTKGQVPEPVPVPSRGRLGWIAAALATLTVVALAADVGGLRSSLLRGGGSADEETAGTTTLASVASVVALPSTVIGEQDHLYLTDAIPSRLTAELARSGAVATRQPPSQLSVAKVDRDLAVLSRAYTVDAFVTSSVVVGEQDFTMQLQLIAANSQEVLWASVDYSGELAQFLEPVRSAASDLASALGSATMALETPLATSENAAAQLAFDEGKYFSDRFNNMGRREDYALSYEAFEEALDLDPGLAVAAAELAFLVSIQIETGIPAHEVAEETQGWIDRALAIDSREGLAWTVQAIERSLREPVDLGAEIEYALRGVAFRADSALAHHVLAAPIQVASIRLGLPAEEESIRQDPLYAYARVGIASGLFHLGEYDEAVAAMGEALAVAPTLTGGPVLMASMLIAIGQYDEAETTLNRFRQAISEGRVDFPDRWTLMTRADLAAARGDTVAADELLTRALDMLDAPGAGYTDGRWAAFVAGEALIRHRPSVALRLLLRAYDLGVRIPFAFGALRDSPRYAPLRDEPAFQNLVESSRRDYDDTIAALVAAQLRGELPAYLEEPLALEVQRARDEG